MSNNTTPTILPTATPSALPSIDPTDKDYWEVGLLWSAISVFVIYMVYRYARKGTFWGVYIATILGWITPFSVGLVLPLDLTSTMYKKCEAQDCNPPLIYVDSVFVSACWRIIYWIMFCLSYIMLPILQTVFMILMISTVIAVILLLGNDLKRLSELVLFIMLLFQ